MINVQANIRLSPKDRETVNQGVEKPKYTFKNPSANKYQPKKMPEIKKKISLKAKEANHVERKMNSSKIHIELNTSKEIKEQESKQANDPSNFIIPTQSQYQEEYSTIINYWDDLGVTEVYRNIFDNTLEGLEPSFKKDFLDFETNSLKKFSDHLTKLSEEITAREKTIELFYKFDKLLAIKEKEKEEVGKKILDDIMSTITKFRILSINIVNHFMKIREISSYGVLVGKYELDNISRNFTFDKNYLIKIKNDTDFLFNSNLNKFFKFSVDSDPFLISLSESGENGKIAVPIDDSMLTYIRQCQFIVLHELIYYELFIYNSNKADYTINTGKSSASTNKRKSGNSSNVRKHNELKPLGTILPSKSPDIRIQKTPAGNYRREKDTALVNELEYNKVLNKDKSLGNINNKSHIQASSNSVYTNTNINNTPIINEVEKSKIESILNESKTSHRKEISIKDKDLRMIEKLMKEQHGSNTTKEIKDKHYSNFTSAIQPDKFDKTTVSNINLNTISNIGVANKTIKNEKIVIDDTKSKIEHERNEKLAEGRNESKTHALLTKMDNVLLSAELSENFDEIFGKESKLDNKLEEFKDNVSVPLETEIDNNLEEFDKSKLNFIFYNGNISKFNSKYREYFKSVNEEQKTAFKLSNNIFDYLKGTFAKVVSITHNNKLIGVSVIYFDSMNETSLRLVLANFSTIRFDNFYEILSEYIEFLKLNLTFDEVFLEIYYGYSDDKFTINAYINDIIKKKLMFKWITLENTGTERKTKYKLITQAANHSPEALSKYILNVKNNITISLEELRENSSEISTIRDKNLEEENEINLFIVTYLIVELKANGLTIDHNIFKINQDKFRRIANKFMKFISSNYKDVRDFIKENISKDLLINTFQENLLHSSLLYVSNKFENIFSVNYGNYIYNKIEVNKIIKF